MTHEKIKNENLDIMCRVCLQRSDDRIDLFSSLAGYSTISNAVMECAPIQIIYGDHLPSTICQSCIVQLDVAYRFRVQCVQSDITLRQLLASTIIEITDNIIVNDDNPDEVKQEKYDQESVHSNEDGEDIKHVIEFNNDEIHENEEVEEEEEDDEDNSPIAALAQSVDKSEENVINTDTEDIKIDVKPIPLKEKHKKFSCNICMAKFSRRAHLLRHQKNCLIGTEIDDKGNVINAYVSKTSAPAMKIKLKPYATFKENIERDANGRYSCRICNKTYKSKYHTARHAIVHSDYRFRCPHCDKCFVRQTALRAHINVHTGKRGYNCEFCGKIFRTDSALNTHRRIHLGVRPYKCHVCERTFTQNKTLKNHMRTHTGERPYVCETCGRSFNRKHILKTHTMIHTGERPHRCDLCNRTFICKQHLQLHLIKHTGEPTSSFRCNVCDKRFTTHSIKLKHEFDMHQLSSLI